MPRVDRVIGKPIANAIGVIPDLKSTAGSGQPPARVRGVVRLWSREADLVVSLKHAERPQVLQERAGGWREVPRTGLTSVTAWDGSKALRIKLVLWLDGWSEIPRRPVDKQVDAVRLLGYRIPSLKRPPTFKVIGAVPYSDGGVRPDKRSSPPDWVLDGLEVEELLHTSQTGTVARAKLTLTLLEYIPSDVDRQKLKAPTGTKSYRWHKGDTLASVARDELGDSRRADWIRKANPKVKSWASLKPGTSIRIPDRPS